MNTGVGAIRLPNCPTCGTPRWEFPRCRCGHRSYSHDIGSRKGVKVRTACSAADANGPCGCRMFEEVPDA